MSDLIDRQAAIDTLRGYLVGKRCPDDGTLTCRLIENEVINKLPPAQPKRIRGRWTRDNACSECGCQPWFSGDIHNYNFCPHCGADMREVTE